MGKTAEGFGQRSHARTAAVGSRLPIPAHVQQDQTRIVLRQAFVGHAPFGKASRPEVFDQNVGTLHQAPKDLLTFGRLDVDRGQQLVPRSHAPPQGLAVLEAADPAHLIACRVLNLDNSCAEVSKQSSHQWSGEKHAYIDDGQSRQWA